MILNLLGYHVCCIKNRVNTPIKNYKMTKTFQHVSYLWNEQKAAELAGDEVALLVYRSNLLGADLRLTNYGGGNTSCKALAKDPLTGQMVEVMWVKGSGGDLGTMQRSGLAALYVERLRSLKNVYRGLAHEDAMVELFNHCIYDLASKAPSIDTPLHGFLPFRHIDHLHPDAAIAIAAAKDGRRITEELFGGTVGWVDWQRPGFDLGLQLLACLEENAQKGIALAGHYAGFARPVYLGRYRLRKLRQYPRSHRDSAPNIWKKMRAKTGRSSAGQK